MDDVPSEVTIGELYRYLQAMEKRVNDQFISVGARFDKLQFVNKETYNVQFTSLEERVNILEEAKTWFGRTLVAAFVFPILVAAIVTLLVTR